jgi:class 3 adenylate cyclase/tetratricopeptide (TPR) repeat protein
MVKYGSSAEGAVRNITEWLESLGLSEYRQRFTENDIDLSVLPDLTDEDLKELGVSLGHRRKLLRAIAELSHAPPGMVAAPPATTHDSAERRQLTVMFCDLVGSTALAVRLDPEELGEIISAYHRRCAEVIVKSDGFVARYMGDAVMAFFGYPHAHEDDVERAVRVGLTLVEAVAELGKRSGVDLQVRVGIATGLVVVGDFTRKGVPLEHEVVGESPNLASRLQALAEPGTVIVDNTSRRLLGELFEYRDLGPVPLKGFDQPVPIWQVTGVSSVDSRFEALRATTNPLVGRDEEIELLTRRWQQAKRGEGCVVVISGEPGIGKSRITQALLERLATEPHTPIRLFCSPHHQDSALYPSITQLERAANFRREDTGSQRLDKLEALLSQATPNNLNEVVPLIASLLSISTHDRYPTLNLSPQKQKERTFQALIGQVEGLAAWRPVLIVVEDAQWSDPTSRELFHLLIDRIAGLQVLVIITCRPEFAPPWLGRPELTLLSLNRLPPRQRIEMIHNLTGGKALPKEVTDQIIDHTDGVPLFIEELTKAIVESGVLTDVGDRFVVPGPLPPLAIPTSLNASLLARFDRLGSVREVAQIAAAIGRHFSHDLISATASIPRRKLDEALAQLVSAELIFQRGTPPDAEYTFKHALVQDAIYGTLLRSRRHQLHGRIAATLEDKFPEIVRTRPELLVRHCAEAGLVEKAVGYCLKAGQQAMARWAMTEAEAQVRKGLELASTLRDGAARQELELGLQLTLGHALLATLGYGAQEPHEAYARARQLCTELNRPRELARILVGQYLFSAIRGELLQAEHHAAEIRELGEAQNDAMWNFTSSNLSGVICTYLGKFTESRAHFENAVRLWDPKFRAFAASPADGYVSALIHFSRTLLCLGYVDQARLRRDEALVEARRLSPYSLAFALCNAGHNDWGIGGANSAPTMLRSADEVLAICSEQNFALLLGVGNIMRGWSLGALGRPMEGIEPLLRGLATFRATGSKLLLPFYLLTLAELYGWADQPGEGLHRVDEAAQLIEGTQERWIEAEVSRVRGTLLLRMRKHAEAEESYQRALAVARRQNAKFWELRAAIELAQLWRDQGKRAEAHELLSPVYCWFADGFDTPVLQHANALLQQLA